MKKVVITALLFFFGLTQVNAQVSFKPGLRAGLNLSHFTQTDDSDEEFKSKSDFYIGGYGELKLTKYYTLQPEITYSRQGSKYEYVGTVFGPGSSNSTTFDVTYLSFAVVNKFTFNDKFNFHVGPTIDFLVEKDRRIDYNSDVDLAFLLGLGYNFNSNFGIEARVKKGIVPVVDYNDSQTNVVFSFGATYTFDIK